MKHTIILISTLFLVPMTVSSDPIESACKQFNRQISIYRPQGVVVNQRVRRNLVGLEMEVYINQEERSNPMCNLCANATLSGRRRKLLQINKPHVLVLPGDNFQYTVTKRYRNGPPAQLSCQFRVSGDRMIPSHPAVRHCPENAPRNNVVREINYAAEKRLLEDTINELLSACEAAGTTKMLILLGNYQDIESEKALKRYVIGRLDSLLPSVEWDGTVENVYRSNGRFVFEVKTALLKLKILHLVRDAEAAASIVDYDTQARSTYDRDDYFDEDYDEHESTTGVVEVMF
uniref:CBM39 domain-containing protein n=1 Tax=Anopheles melas TaxID=34690 RepID=A0A182TW28_9DIPT